MSYVHKIVEVQARIVGGARSGARVVDVPLFVFVVILEVELQEVFKSSSIWTCQRLDPGEEISGDQAPSLSTFIVSSSQLP